MLYINSIQSGDLLNKIMSDLILLFISFLSPNNNKKALLRARGGGSCSGCSRCCSERNIYHLVHILVLEEKV